MATHLLGSKVLFAGMEWRVAHVSTLIGLTLRTGHLEIKNVDPDQCVCVSGSEPPPETLADRLFRVWEPILGTFARERANNCACWAEQWVTPQGLLLDLSDALSVCNRADYGGTFTPRQIARAAALGAAVVLA